MYNIFNPVGVLVDVLGLPIDFMDGIGVFAIPVGVMGVLVDAVGLPIDLMDVIWVLVDPVGVQGGHEQHGLVLRSHISYPVGVLVDAVGLPI
jgi:hypothetical protein